MREHSRKLRHPLREKSHAQTVPLAFALLLVTELLPVEPVASAAAELAAAEAPTAYPFRDRRQSVGCSKPSPGPWPRMLSDASIGNNAWDCGNSSRMWVTNCERRVPANEKRRPSPP